MKISFVVFGKPEPKGSMRAFTPKGWKRPIITDGNPNVKPWAQQIHRTALDEMAKQREGLAEPFPREMPIVLYLHFRLERPASLPKRVTQCTKKPDLDKLTRAVKDALKGAVYHDDSQVCRAVLSKSYGNPGVEITVETLESEARLEPSATLDLFARTA